MLSWLFPASRGGATEELSRCLRRGLRRIHVEEMDVAIPRMARDVVWTELASLVSRIMTTDAGSIVRYGWATSDQLVQAARRTMTDPGSCEVITLADHTIRYADVAEIDVAVDEMVAVTVNVRVQADLHVTALAVGIEHGQVMHLRCAKAVVTVRLFVQDDDVAHRTVGVDLEEELELVLATGIPLLPSAAASEPES
jgi:hypothetical protein